jgi:endonuclease YncB( thermonuclease family)
MPSKLIKGTYHVKNRAPDGDSIAFQANNTANWDFFNWSRGFRKPTPEKNRPIQLRIEGIDSLETHYEGFTQPLAIAKSATDALLRAFGIPVLTYNLNFTKIVTAGDAVEGAIIAADVDGYDRPIAYALLGDHGLADGAELPALTDAMVELTINYKLAADGLVYPTFYTTTNETGLAAISRAAAAAIEDRRGIWAFDRSLGFQFWGPRTILEEAVILPKLFRRLVNFCEESDDMAKLAVWLAGKRDPFTVISTGQRFQKLSDLVFVNGREVGLKFDPLDVMFRPTS